MNEQIQDSIHIIGNADSNNFRVMYNGALMSPEWLEDFRDPIHTLLIIGVKYNTIIPPNIQSLNISWVRIVDAAVDLIVLPNKLVKLRLMNCYIKKSERREHMTVKHLHIDSNVTLEDSNCFREFFIKVGVFSFEDLYVGATIASLYAPLRTHFFDTHWEPNEAKLLIRSLPECRGIGLTRIDSLGLEDLYRTHPSLDPALARLFIRWKAYELYRGKKVTATHRVGGKIKPIYELKTSDFNKFDVPPISGTAENEDQGDTDVSLIIIRYLVDELFKDDDSYDTKIPLYQYRQRHGDLILKGGKPMGYLLLFWTAQNPPDEYTVETLVSLTGQSSKNMNLRCGIRYINGGQDPPPRNKLVDFSSTRKYLSPAPSSMKHEWPSRSDNRRVHREGSMPTPMPTIQRLNNIHKTREAKEAVEAVERTLADLLSEAESELEGEDKSKRYKM